MICSQYYKCSKLIIYDLEVVPELELTYRAINYHCTIGDYLVRNSCGQSYEASMIVIYDSRVVPDSQITTLDS